MEKRARGRPVSNGKQPGWRLMRVFVVLEAFIASRTADDKYVIALGKAAQAWKDWTGRDISETTVKRILAEAMPKESNYVLTLNQVKPNSIERNTRFESKSFEFGYGPRPKHLLPKEIQQWNELFGPRICLRR